MFYPAALYVSVNYADESVGMVNTKGNMLFLPAGDMHHEKVFISYISCGISRV